MNVTLRPATAGTMAAVHPRIRYIDPMATADLSAAVARAAALGFESVLIPYPGAPGPGGDRLAPASLERADPALAAAEVADFLRSFVRACRQQDIRPMLDVPLAAPGKAPAPAQPLDPRLLGAGQPSPDSEAAAERWSPVLRRWRDLGVAGYRLLDLDAVAPAVPKLRAELPGALLIAWTPGVPRAALPALAGVDYTVSSLPWWDGEASWFWDEMEALSAIAPVISCPEAPFGPRLAASVHNPALLGAVLRRAASLAAATGDGWIVPEGFETGSRRPMSRRGATAAAAETRPAAGLDLAELNRQITRLPVARGIHFLAGGGGSPLALLRTDAADARFAAHATVALLNNSLERPRSVDPAALIACIDGAFGPWSPAPFVPGQPVTLLPGELRSFSAPALSRLGPEVRPDSAAARQFADGPRVAIEAPSPCIDDGSLPVKRVLGESVTVEADIVCDGHDKLGAVLLWRFAGEQAWQEVRMQPAGNDRYRADFPLIRMGRHEYDVQAWRDAFASYKDEIAKKSAAGVDVSLELREGMALLARTVARLPEGELRRELAGVAKAMEQAPDADRLARFLSPEMAEWMQAADDRPRAARLRRPVLIDAERAGAAFSAWYEVFPRSLSDDPARHGTFRDVERHLPRIKAMGFDVLYFPPIHPIGRTNRKGPNNTLTPGPDDPGSPYAIGSAEGGHDALHPELGTLEDFRHLVGAAAEHGLEIAIDFAIQCSPDHPWLKQHRDWFDWRPDGSIKYAENPPKKYQDIVNVDFYAAGAIPSLWVALADVVMFWMEQGVRCIRVDNPHTKPFPFWEWMIRTVRTRFPDAVFLAEAFTRPKVMYRLAKVGFSQSYTYFTWRETKRDMEEYLTELAQPGPRDFFRPHFFVNTPDINPVYLQGAPRAMYLIRAVLAATLSGLWGVYNGFELCEGTPLPGREEYLDSEKYQIRQWDWDRPGNIVAEITALNRLRHANPALRSHLNTTFLPAGNDAVSVYLKATPDRSNALVITVSYDGRQAQETGWEFPFWLWQADETAAFEAEDMLTGARETWRGKARFVRLDPDRPYSIWRVSALS